MTLTFYYLDDVRAAGCEMTSVSREELAETARQMRLLGLHADSAHDVLAQARRQNPALSFTDGDVSALAALVAGDTEDDGWPDDDDDGDEAENRAVCSGYSATVRERIGDAGFVELARKLRGGL